LTFEDLFVEGRHAAAAPEVGKKGLLQNDANFGSRTLAVALILGRQGHGIAFGRIGSECCNSLCLSKLNPSIDDDPDGAADCEHVFVFTK
jgi:hypothetical protein